MTFLSQISDATNDKFLRLLLWLAVQDDDNNNEKVALLRYFLIFVNFTNFILKISGGVCSVYCDTNMSK